MSGKCVDDFRLQLAGRELIPLMIGGMGVDISTSSLALEAARLGGVGHISDAMLPTVSDRRYQTRFVKDKLKHYKANIKNMDKSAVKFALHVVEEATRLHVEKTMSAKQGNGLVFINCMEKLTMNAARETLAVRLNTALDAGIDGITLAAGLHLSSFGLIADNPRFRDAQLGIIVSSVRALKLFLKKNTRHKRLPDYIVVEGPLAGGHLGFGLDDWQSADLRSITVEVLDYLAAEELDIPVVPAGGIFTGTEATQYLEMGAKAVQLATRFTVTEECGMTDQAKQEFFRCHESDIVVNDISPTGYPMRMLDNSPAIGSGIHPNCEAYGYLLDDKGSCAYIRAWEKARDEEPAGDEKKIKVQSKTCLCTHMRNFDCWTCGALTWRLKDTSRQLEDGSYQLLTAEHVFNDYRFSKNNAIALP